MLAEGPYMGVTKLQARGQVTIPARIRRAFGWRPGDAITFTARPDGVLELRVLKTHSISELVEKYSQAGTAPDIRALRQKVGDIIFHERVGNGGPS